MIAVWKLILLFLTNLLQINAFTSTHRSFRSDQSYETENIYFDTRLDRKIIVESDFALNFSHSLFVRFARRSDFVFPLSTKQLPHNEPFHSFVGFINISDTLSHWSSNQLQQQSAWSCFGEWISLRFIFHKHLIPPSEQHNARRIRYCHVTLSVLLNGFRDSLLAVFGFPNILLLSHTPQFN